jgi:hypothetical protein
VLSNPYNLSELWVTLFGNGLYSGVVAAAVEGDEDDGTRPSNTRRVRQKIMQATNNDSGGGLDSPPVPNPGVGGLDAPSRPPVPKKEHARVTKYTWIRMRLR